MLKKANYIYVEIVKLYIFLEVSLLLQIIVQKPNL